MDQNAASTSGGPPPPPVTTQPSVAAQHVTVVQPVMAPAMGMGMPIFVGAYPIQTVCPRCAAPIMTQIRGVTSCHTHCCACILCWLGFYFCLCLIPYFCDCCKDIEHTCPRCHAIIGIYHRRGCCTASGV